jgi:hypothetical protein
MGPQCPGRARVPRRGSSSSRARRAVQCRRRPAPPPRGPQAGAAGRARAACQRGPRRRGRATRRGSRMKHAGAGDRLWVLHAPAERDGRRMWTRRVQLVRRDGRDVSTLYGREGRGGGGALGARAAGGQGWMAADRSAKGGVSRRSASSARWEASAARCRASSSSRRACAGGARAHVRSLSLNMCLDRRGLFAARRLGAGPPLSGGAGGGARSGACLLDFSLEALDLRSCVRGRKAEGKRERGGRAVAPEQRRAVRAEQREGSG